MNYIRCLTFLVIYMKILIIGGDKRMLFAKYYLETKGFETDTLGLIGGDCGDISAAEIILLPVPSTRDKVNINCPLTQRKVPIDFLKKAHTDTLILSGGLKLDNPNCVDYLALDSYAVLGAIPTAEGAIHCAIENTDFTLWNSKILIIGYGRVSKILANRLLGFGCNLAVSARNNTDFSYLDTLKINHIHTKNVADKINDFDIVFNTIDVPILNGNTIETNTLIIDLSTKGCFLSNEDKANLIRLPAIPGKIAPKTAGEIIAQTVIQQIDLFRR